MEWDQRCCEQSGRRTVGFCSSYFHNTVSEWSLLDITSHCSLFSRFFLQEVTVFKSELLRIFRPEESPVHNIYDVLDINLLKGLRVNLNPLYDSRWLLDSWVQFVRVAGWKIIRISSCAVYGLQRSTNNSSAVSRMLDVLLLIWNQSTFIAFYDLKAETRLPVQTESP